MQTADRLSASRSDAHPPLPRDKRGWQVSPAPDGRGMPEQAPKGPPAHRRPGFMWFVGILLAINCCRSCSSSPTSANRA